MNETASILLATTILALGGFGLYMYKQSNNDESVENKDAPLGDNFWALNDEEEDISVTKDDQINEDYIYDNEDNYKPQRKRSNNKTHKNKKSNSRRKY